jgi:two-component SAPR family response regulator/uncharacterized protein (DUF1810 family)
MSTSLESLCHDLLLSFVKLLELRNPYNIDHCKLVAQYCDKVAVQLGLPNEDRLLMVRAAEVHTLGVLLQMEEKHEGRELPISGLGSLTGREVSIVEREEQIFRRVVSQIPTLEPCIDILLQRHEWYDGTGSILGFKGEDICREARILAVVDAFVDLVTPKAHRPSETLETAVARLRELSGLQFDPTYVQALEDTLSEDERAESAARARKFEAHHCRHYLALGHFYTQIHETDWALRSYVAAQRMAEKMDDQGLELGAISGRFMVFCELQQLERAREILQEVRARGTSQRGKLGYQLLWGLLEWLNEKKLGKEILDGLIAKHRESDNLCGLTAALAFQTCMTLFHQGADDPEHLQYLENFFEIIETHDVFDVVERYRPYTIPVLLNAAVQGVHSNVARNLMTRMGEPCHGPLHQRLAGVHPSQWTKVLMPESVLGPQTEEAAPKPVNDKAVRVTTLGSLEFHYQDNIVKAAEWQTLKTIKLFLRLAMNAGLPVSNDVLAEELWPGSGPKKGRDSLRNGVHQVRRTLRQLLGDEKAKVVDRSRKNQTISLELTCLFDYDEFEAQFARAQEALKKGDTATAKSAGEEALNLYKGTFLDGFDEQWVEAKRARLSAVRMQTMTVVARCQLAEEDFVGAEDSTRALLELDDLREETHTLMIEILGRAGRSAEAVSHYESAIDLFENEIGVAPERLKEPLVDLGLLL